MKKLLENCTVIIESTDKGYRASATVNGVNMSADSSIDYCAISALFNAIKLATLENMKALNVKAY
jgi:hypothetical protein